VGTKENGKKKGLLNPLTEKGGYLTELIGLAKGGGRTRRGGRQKVQSSKAGQGKRVYGVPKDKQKKLLGKRIGQVRQREKDILDPGIILGRRRVNWEPKRSREKKPST